VEGGEECVEGGFVCWVGGEGVEALADGGGELVAGEEVEVCEDLVWGGEGVWGRALGDLEEDVEVVVHDGEGEDADAAEAFTFAEEGDEVVHFGGAEDGALVDDAREAVIEGRGPVQWRLETARAHGESREE
jgi:hypothetical protein